MALTLTSPAFGPGAEIPEKYTCDGADVSPPLEWTGAPADAVTIALIVDDPDARGWVHWVVYDMDAAATGGLPEGFSASPDAPSQGTNDFDRLGWGGPCPPSGTHRYRFTLYALDARVEAPGAPRADDVRAAIDGHVISESELIAKYTRSR